MSKKEVAMEYFTQGYNCAQSVLLAFKDECRLDEDVLARLAMPYGGGISRLRSVCGCVNGMVMAYGLIFGKPGVVSGDERGEHYIQVQELVKEFGKKNGSFICGDLLRGVKVSEGARPEDRTDEYYKKRPCKELVGDAAEILESFIQKQD